MVRDPQRLVELLRGGDHLLKHLPGLVVVWRGVDKLLYLQGQTRGDRDDGVNKLNAEAGAILATKTYSYSTGSQAGLGPPVSDRGCAGLAGAAARTAAGVDSAPQMCRVLL